MNQADFQKGFPGKLVATYLTEYLNGPMAPPTQTKTLAFVPDPLPPKIDWKALQIEHFDRYSETLLALGKINGLHKRVGNAAAMLRTLWMREAKLSSEVENIHTTAEELVLAGAGRLLHPRDSSLESWNYVRALEHGIHSDLPWSSRLIREMHAILLQSVRGKNHRPGLFRDKGVYLSGPLPGAQHARFIPMPPGDELLNAIRDLEAFVNNSHDHIPPLFAVAITHYQFETIHPFSDGNGRIGRVLISRSLVKEKLLEHPVVYMSAYINENRKQYVDLLLRISQQGGQAWSDWIGFFLEAIRTQTLDAIWRSEELINLQVRFQDLLKTDGAPTRLFPVVESLFASPAMNIADLMKHTQTTKTTAGKDMERLERLGIVREITGRERERDWLAQDIVDVISKESPQQ
ncbi:Fic family protein [Pirellulaceae bacterium SH467]